MTSSLQTTQLKVGLQVDAKVIHHGDLQAQDLILLLHGYCQSAKSFSYLLEESLHDKNWICVQAPFPVPVVTKLRTLMGYSWYFFDMKENQFYVPMSVATDYLTAVLDAMGVLPRIRRVVGFSQGGFLAPFASLNLPNVAQVIVIGGRLKLEEFQIAAAQRDFWSAETQFCLPFRLDHIHGELDTQVDFLLSQQVDQEARQRGIVGQFAAVPKAGHDIVDELTHQLRKSLAFTPV